MDVKDVATAQQLFSDSPGLAVILVLAVIVAWVVRVDALGFVSRAKDKKRARVFDTYEKLKEMGGLSEADRESMVEEIRGAGVGLPMRTRVESPRGEEEQADEPAVRIPPVATHVVRAADAILSTFGKVAAVGVVAVMLVAGTVILLAAGSSKDPVVVVCGLFFGPWILFGAVRGIAASIRGVAENYPRRLRFVVEWIDWVERRAERVSSLGAISLVAGAHVGLIGFGAFFSYQLAVESDSVLGWSLAGAIGVATAAGAVKFSIAGLTFLGILEGEDPEPAASP